MSQPAGRVPVQVFVPVSLLSLLCAGLVAAAPSEPAPTSDDPPSYETVVRSEARAPRTATERTADAREVATAPARSADDLLRLAPGLVVSRHGGEGKAPQLFLRGFDAEHGADLEVLFEGIPLNERSNVHGNGYLDLGMVLPEAVRRVDVRRGPFDLGQGPFATAGTVSFGLGVEEDDVGPRLGLELGTTRRARAIALHAPAARAGRDVVALEAMRDEGFGPNRQAERVAGAGRWTVHARGPWAVSLVGAAQAARFGDPGVAPLPDVEAGRLGFYETWREDTGGRSLRALLSPQLAWTQGASRADVRAWVSARDLELEHDYTGFYADEVRGDRRRQTHRAYGGGLRAEGSTPLGSLPLRLLGNAGWMGERLARAEVGVPHASLEGAAETSSLDEDGTQHALHAAVGAQWRPWQRLRIEGGARVDGFISDATGRETLASAVVSPRLNVQLRPIQGEGLLLFAAAGRGVRPPDLQQSRPVTAESAEVGARWGLLRLPLIVDAAAWGTRVAEELRFDHLSSTLVDQGRSLRAGVDAGVQWEPFEWLRLRAEASFAQARLLDTDEPVPGVPPFSGSVHGTVWHPSGVRAGLRFQALGERPLPYGAVASGYAVLDATVGYRAKRWELQLAVDNVTGARYREGEYHFPSRFDPEAPRSGLPVRHFSPGHPLAARLGLSVFL